MSYARHGGAGSFHHSAARADIDVFVISSVTFSTVGTISARTAATFSGLRFANMRGAGA
ncbi:hypothetical protein J2805_004458 [Arthrobacter oryzae]|nr:hypothetical protein [Arthrobacter oryzae]